MADLEPLGQSLYSFQAALKESGETLGDFIRQNYISKWQGNTLYFGHADNFC